MKTSADHDRSSSLDSQPSTLARDPPDALGPSSGTTHNAAVLQHDLKKGTKDPLDDEKDVQAGGNWRLKGLGEAADNEDDEGQEKLRTAWWQLWRPKTRPPPAPSSFDDPGIIPLASANFFEIISFSWITPMMNLGYRRTLQATDLWRLDPSRESAPSAERLLLAFSRRRAEADEYNARLAAGDVKPPVFKRAKWALSKGQRSDKEQEWRIKDGKKKASLAWSLNEGVALFFWTGGLFKVVGDTAQLMSPLVTRQIILFAQERARHTADPEQFAQPHIGRGVGMALGLFFLTIMASVCQHQFFWRSMSVGVTTRARLTTCIYRISMFLSQKERTHLSNGKLMNHLSADVSRVDFAAQWFHAWWTAPIQLAITTVLLIIQIGPSALVGISLFAILTPVQTRVMRLQFDVRKKSMKWTDARSRLLQELLGSFSIIKYFTLERPFLDRIAEIRGNELVGIRSILLIKAANQSIAMSLPTLAAVVSFLCYSGTGHSLDPANIFTALSLFQLLRQPLMFLPRALSAIADASNALERLEVVFQAETLDQANEIDPDLDVGIRVQNASFEWLTAPPEEEEKKSKSGKRVGKKDKGEVKEVEETEEKVEHFKVEKLNMEVKRGAITALVGKVGSGKSSILNAIIGEMKKTSPDGKVIFGGRVAYCSQSAFIQNASLRENVLFGQPFEEARYWEVMANACLIADCLTLGDADNTEIGEKGINISGGQRQRINVARALYYDADIVIFDDPLSAVDAGVSQALFQDAMISALRNKGKAVLLVTHALHILPEVDFIYTVEDGRIVEDGTYVDLMAAKGPFARLLQEFGGDHADEDEDGEDAEIAAKNLAIDNKLRRAEAMEKSAAAAGTGRLEGRLMVAEKRVKGKVSTRIYAKYLKAARGAVTAPLLLLAAFIMQGSLVLSSVWLTWWQGDHFHMGQGEYMGVYACLGVLQAIFTFLMGSTMAVISYNASGALHHAALERLFFAPMALFNSTPLGRIMSVVGKDIDVADNLLSDSLRMGIMTIANVFGSTILIAIFFPYFLIAIVIILFGYAYFQQYYRRSAREIKRIDSMLRSLLYGHFSESLNGLSTIRAYAVTKDYVKHNSYYMDLESRALYLICTNQRWLAIRLDSLGAVLSFVVGIMCVVGVRGISAAQVGLVLSFCVTLTQQLGMVTRQTAEIENNMNSVERVVHYADLPEQEAAYEIKDKKTDSSWPQLGQVEFRDVVMAYRPDLPPVLKGINVNVRGGDKIGIIGRTGAGKSSIMAALFRMVELRSGSIWIDGLDISTLGLYDLRSSVAIIPQDPQLFSGTIRSNLDPFGKLSDAELWSALRRAHLVNSTDASEKFHLDTAVDEDGANFSVGQRSLLSLARALCKEARILVLDEATASVDLASDAKIQQTIATEFADKTLLCIAHRLRTILHFDRIICLDKGVIAEVGTPLELFHQDGHFKAMCLKSNITEADFAPRPEA